MDSDPIALVKSGTVVLVLVAAAVVVPVLIPGILGTTIFPFSMSIGDAVAILTIAGVLLVATVLLFLLGRALGLPE